MGPAREFCLMQTPGGWAVGSTSARGPRKERLLTGNSECGFGIVVSRVETLCDLLTHFIGIEKTT